MSTKARTEIPETPAYERIYEAAVGVGTYLFTLGIFLHITSAIAVGLAIIVVAMRIQSRLDDEYWGWVYLRDRKV